MKIQNDRTERSKEAFKNPLPGDYWSEMFCPYFVVLKKTEQGTLIICDKNMATDPSHWTWDLEKAIEVPMEYMQRVKYETIDAFVADVSNGHRWAIAEWEQLGSPYVAIAEVKPNYDADFRTVMEQGV